MQACSDRVNERERQNEWKSLRILGPGYPTLSLSLSLSLALLVSLLAPSVEPVAVAGPHSPPRTRRLTLCAKCHRGKRDTDTHERLNGVRDRQRATTRTARRRKAQEGPESDLQLVIGPATPTHTPTLTTTTTPQPCLRPELEPFASPWSGARWREGGHRERERES